jgi:hypothetical protein
MQSASQQHGRAYGVKYQACVKTSRLMVMITEIAFGFVALHRFILAHAQYDASLSIGVVAVF